MEWFSAEIALKEDRGLGFLNWPICMSIQGIKLPTLIENREGLPFQKGEGIQAIIGFIVVESRWQRI
jgi:hypothetical protein